MVRQKAILDLALQFENACTTKEDLRKAYEKCNDIPQDRHALIDTFLKEGSNKDYELNLSMYRKTAKIEKLPLTNPYRWFASQIREICDVYLTEKELHQLHIEEEVLREILEEESRDEKERVKKIRQKQADDEEFFFKFGVVKIIPGPVGIVQAAKLLKQRDILHGLDGDVMSTQEYMKKVIEDVGKDEDFKNGSWVSTIDYVNANGGTVSGCLGDIKNFLNNEKLEQVVAIVKSCSPNVIGDLTVTMKDLSGTIAGTIHHKVIDEGGYEKDITAGAALILTNVSVFSPKPSMHYLNITRRNVVKVFRKDTIPESGSGEGFLTEKEQQQLALDEEALRESLEEEARDEKERARAEKEWEKRKKEEQAQHELFMLEFGVKSDSKYETD
ncbi:transposase, MuDR, MULE transposase domain protein [Tanacetum coccineum]